MKKSHCCYLSICALLLSLFRPLIAASPPTNNPYESLPITAEEKHLISKLLTTMAENNIFMLLLEKKRLEKIGGRIHHVHPLRFLGTVFTDSSLTSCMREIRKSKFKWEGFMDGFTERMRDEARRDQLAPYIPGFAKAVDRNPEQIMSYIQGSDFENLVKFLLY